MGLTLARFGWGGTGLAERFSPDLPGECNTGSD
jgi:hypothetical protein